MSFQDIWTEKYRPKTFEEYVWTDTEREQKFKEIVDSGKIPGHLLLTGSAGTGKTSAALMLLKLLNVDDFDILKINASEENGIDVVRNKIKNFTVTWGMGDMKYVLLDECDYLSPAAQAALRNLTETYADNTRFIFTANYINKIIPALISRCYHFHFDTLDKDQFRNRIATILVTENVSLDGDALDILDSYIQSSYPDMRKCINQISQNITNNTLKPLTSKTSNTKDYLTESLQLFIDGKINEARKIIISNVREDEYVDVFRWMYENIELFDPDENNQSKILQVIKQGLVDHAICADPEINLSATIVQVIETIKS